MNLPSEIQVADFRTDSLPLATALGTMGVPLWTEVTNILGGKNECDEVNERHWYQYRGDKPVPAGFRDHNNTYREKCSASELLKFHRLGQLAKWAPNHPLFVMISAEINRGRLLEHLFKTQHLSLHLVSPEDLAHIPSHQGAPHYQLFAETAGTPTDSPCRPVTKFPMAVALATAGFEFDSTRTEVRRPDSGGLAFRLWFHETSPVHGSVLPYLNYLKAATEGAQLNAAYTVLRFAFKYMGNRARIKQEAQFWTPQLIFKAPDALVKSNPYSRHRVAQTHEDAVEKQEPAIMKFLGRRKRHH